MELDGTLKEILTQEADVIAFHFDIDGTIVLHGLPKKTYDLDGVEDAAKMKSLDPSKYNEVEQANLGMIVRRVLDGKPMSGITGREAPFLIGDYLREKIDTAAEEEGLEKVDGRWIAKNGHPLILTMTSMSGVWTYDVLSPEHEFIEPETVQKVPQSLILGLSVYADLFRASTPKSRMDLIAQTTPQWVGTDWDYALISPTLTRVNLAVDHEMIIANKQLKGRWNELTGVKIKSRMDLLEALKFFEEKWDVSIHGANNHIALDIVPEGINKAVARERVHRYIRKVYKQFGIKIKNLGQISIGDSPDGNDKSILQDLYGISVVEPMNFNGNYPYFFNQLPEGVNEGDLGGREKQIYRTYAFLNLLEAYGI